MRSLAAALLACWPVAQLVFVASGAESGDDSRGECESAGCEGDGQ